MKNIFFVKMSSLMLFLLFDIYAQKDSIEELIPPGMQMTEYDADNGTVVSPMIYDGRAHPCAWLACICCWGTIGGVAGGAIGIWNTPGMSLLNNVSSQTALIATNNAVNGCKIGFASCTPAALILASPSVARKTNEICKRFFVKGNE